MTVGDCIEDKRITFESDIVAADERRCISAAVENALNELPEAEREAVILFYFRGMTYIGIAELKRYTAAEVRRLVSHGLRKLQHPRITRQLLEADVDRHTAFYRHWGLDTFKTTWTSSTEQTAIERERIRK